MHGTVAKTAGKLRQQSDEALLDALLKRLRATGVVEFSGEFGNEITTFIPLAHWLKREGHLNGRRVRTYQGMRPYYFFLDDDQLETKSAQRTPLTPLLRDWPSNRTYAATKRYWHAPPDFRAYYAGQARRFEKPILFVQNKFAAEWNFGPINFLPLGELRRLLKLTSDRFQIIYSRPGAIADLAGYSLDDNSFCHYPDLAVLKEFPEALILEEMVRDEGRPYNEVKLEVLAGAYAFFTVQGGSAHILSAFGESLLAILHRRGDEYPHAYARGPYKFLSPSPPEILVARTDAQLRHLVKMFAHVDVVDDKVAMNTMHPQRWLLRT
ncbi:MAG TPA: hypothetical protein VM915_00560 [Verrucomicrobiae bacterium]|nr:hypothetical protein [Verrucomicrobiae bacterium]